MLNSVDSSLAGSEKSLDLPAASPTRGVGLALDSSQPDNLAYSGNQLVVIDAAVENIDQLIANIETAQVVVLNDEQDGIAQISQILADYSTANDSTADYSTTEAAESASFSGRHLDSLHVISHGDRGSLQLGNTLLDAASLSHYQDQLSQWKEWIAPEGDVLLYGCNVAAGPEGLQLIDQLSQLTGADVAASDDLTGRGGDWSLEATTGSVEAQVILDTIAQNTYSGTLATYNGKEYVLTEGAKSWEVAQAEAVLRGGNLVTINDAQEETFLKQAFGETDGFWIGISDRIQEGVFTWASGEAVTYTNWAPGEPNDYRGNQDYGWMNFGSTRQWDDHDPFIQLRGIVELNSPVDPPTNNPGVIGLETSTITVDEEAGNVEVTVLRQQGSDGIVTVDYSTVAGSATVGEDYQARSGTLTFAEGETQKSVLIPIVSDTQDEGNEQFGFAIDNVNGGATLLAPRTAQITINDTADAALPTFRGNQYVLTTGLKTWEAAQVEAKQIGGNLVTINSREEESWLQSTFGTTEAFWIGINDIRQEGQFEWASGEAVTYTNWAPGEPNDYQGNQDYGQMNFGSARQWDDHHPDITLRGVIEIGDNNTPPGPVDPPPSTTPTAQTVISRLNQPAAIDWIPGTANMFVAEKGGVVKVYENGNLRATPFIDISDQVNSARDRGLLDIAIHPDFANNPYVYLLFTYDPPEVYNNTGDAGPDGRNNRAGRLIRVTADANNNFRTAVAGSEVVLLGKNSTWNNFNGFTNSTVNFNEPPAGILPDGSNLQDFLAADSESHTIGAVEFGLDGALYVSNGDGTSFNRRDPRTVRVQDIDNLSGKILRIDPITGRGLNDNPFYNGDPTANRSKVYQLGLRNPFRFAIHPDTGVPIIGDVGWTQWEEINAGEPGANFGWPYYEGDSGTNERTGGYRDLPEAIAFYNSNPSVTPSLFALNHGADGINAVIMGDVYRGNGLCCINIFGSSPVLNTASMAGALVI